jgi:cell shape-determining protein MreD
MACRGTALLTYCTRVHLSVFFIVYLRCSSSVHLSILQTNTMRESENILHNLYPVILWNCIEIPLGYQPSQVVKRRKKQRFENHLRPRPHGTDIAGD